MKRRFVWLLGSTVVLVSSCATRERGGRVEGALFDAAGRANVGSLEHRGRRYDLRELLDAGARRGSADEFLRTFEPESVYAGLWAGL